MAWKWQGQEWTQEGLLSGLVGCFGELTTPPRPVCPSVKRAWLPVHQWHGVQGQSTSPWAWLAVGAVTCAGM